MLILSSGNRLIDVPVTKGCWKVLSQTKKGMRGSCYSTYSSCSSEHFAQFSQISLTLSGKVGDCNWGWPEDSLFDSYYNKV